MMESFNSTENVTYLVSAWQYCILSLLWGRNLLSQYFSFCVFFFRKLTYYLIILQRHVKVLKVADPKAIRFLACRSANHMFGNHCSRFLYGLSIFWSFLYILYICFGKSYLITHYRITQKLLLMRFNLNPEK